MENISESRNGFEINIYVEHTNISVEKNEPFLFFLELSYENIAPGRLGTNRNTCETLQVLKKDHMTH